MIIALVTDRRRLAGTAATFAEARACLVRQAEFAVEAAIDIVQVRERDLEAADLARLVRDLVAVARGSRTRVVVNDRLDVALVSGAAGVHLRGDSIPVAAARRIAPAGFLVGRSVHSVEDVEPAAAADYLIAGTVFPSASKPDGSAWLGVDGLRGIVERTASPVLGIGGISETTVDAIARTGAAGIAAIGAFVADPAECGDVCRAIPISGWADRVRQRFDAAQLALIPAVAPDRTLNRHQRRGVRAELTNRHVNPRDDRD